MAVDDSINKECNLNILLQKWIGYVMFVWKIEDDDWALNLNIITAAFAILTRPIILTISCTVSHDEDMEMYILGLSHINPF